MKQTIIGDDSLLVDISDALSERDRVRFTVHTRTKLPSFAKPVMSVVRQHEEFVWLHDCLEENDQYAGYIIPPAPPRPDFDASREKLQRLGDGEPNMTKDEFAKVKQELEAEYLAIFKKTVAMHEIFLQRLAAHDKFRLDNNLKIFLEYENDLSVRCKSTKEKLAGSIQNIGKSLTDFVITTSQVAATTSVSTSSLLGNHQHPSSRLSRPQSTSTLDQALRCNIKSSDTNVDNTGDSASNEVTQTSSSMLPIVGGSDLISNLGRDTNDTNNNNNPTTAGTGQEMDEQYFERERLFLALYYNSIKEAATQADRVCQVQKCLADSYLNFGQNLVKLASVGVVPKLLLRVSDYFEQAKKIETRIASDEDLKITDTLLYYKRETAAAQDLLARRLKFMAEYETALKNVEKARQKGRTQMQYAEVIQKQAKENFVSISQLAKQELMDYKKRRVAAFKKAFTDLVELELKHLRNHSQLITNCLNSLTQIPTKGQPGSGPGQESEGLVSEASSQEPLAEA